MIEYRVSVILFITKVLRIFYNFDSNLIKYRTYRLPIQFIASSAKERDLPWSSILCQTRFPRKNLVDVSGYI